MPTPPASIRNLMFVFEDFLALDQKSIKEVLAQVDRKVLTIALKGTSDSLKNSFHLVHVATRRGNAERRYGGRRARSVSRMWRPRKNK